MSSVARRIVRSLTNAERPGWRRGKPRGQRYGGLPGRVVWPPGGADFSDQRQVKDVLRRIAELEEKARLEAEAAKGGG